MMAFVFIVVHTIVIVAAAFQVYRRETMVRKVFWPAFAIKISCGILVGVLYTYYYTVSDTFIYYGDALELASLARMDFFSYVRLLISDHNLEALQLALTEPRALFMTKITSVFALISGGSYWVIAMYFSFFTFLSALFLTRVVGRNIPPALTAAVITLFFLPSAVFWSSGVLKESLAVASLFFLTAFFLKVWFHERIGVGQICMVVAAAWVLWNLKYYYAGIFLAVAATAFVYEVLIGRRFRLTAVPETVLWLALLALPLLAVSHLHPNFFADRFLSVVLTNNEAYSRISDAGDYVRFHELAATPVSILLNAPWALFSGLFRPLFWEADTVLQLAQGVENTLLLILSVGVLFRLRAYRTFPHRRLVLAAMVYVILLGVFITLSAPNFGTLSRYRTGFIFLFALVVLCGTPVIKYAEGWIGRLVRE